MRKTQSERSRVSSAKAAPVESVSVAPGGVGGVQMTPADELRAAAEAFYRVAPDPAWMTAAVEAFPPDPGWAPAVSMYAEAMERLRLALAAVSRNDPIPF